VKDWILITCSLVHEQGLPNPFKAARYHSLVIDRDSCPEELTVTAWTEDGVIMGVQHKSHQHIQVGKLCCLLYMVYLLNNTLVPVKLGHSKNVAWCLMSLSSIGFCAGGPVPSGECDHARGENHCAEFPGLLVARHCAARSCHALHMAVMRMLALVTWKLSELCKTCELCVKPLTGACNGIYI
jgi:hypothetical protein